MAIDLRTLVAPSTTAIVASECQNGVLGPQSSLPELAAAAVDNVIPNGARLLTGARAAGVQVIHSVFWRRADWKGANSNGRLFVAMRKMGAVVMEPGSELASPIPEFSPSEQDIVLGRYHGLDPFGGTDLDPVLRNLGITTVVVMGVSLNVALIGLCVGLVNAGYQVVVPRDAVTGVPSEYAEAMLTYTYPMVATISDTDQLLAAWSA